jgi:hypothetical protein
LITGLPGPSLAITCWHFFSTRCLEAQRLNPSCLNRQRFPPCRSSTILEYKLSQCETACTQQVALVTAEFEKYWVAWWNWLKTTSCDTFATKVGLMVCMPEDLPQVADLIESTAALKKRKFQLERGRSNSFGLNE